MRGSTVAKVRFLFFFKSRKGSEDALSGGRWLTLPQKLTWYGGFRKWWCPTTMGFPTKNDHFGVFWGYHHLSKHPYIGNGCLGLTIRLPFAGVLDYFQGRTVSHECFPETLTHPRKFWWIDTKKWWALENRISLSNMAILGIYVQFQGGTVSLADKIHLTISWRNMFFFEVLFFRRDEFTRPKCTSNLHC